MVYRPNIDPTSCFVLMPFQEPHIEYFSGIIQPAARDAGLTAIKADDIYGTAPIIQDIWNQIWRARAVIADVTRRNPNVNYELGICHALGIPTVLITQNLADVPFDYRHIRCIVYDTKRVGWEDKLRFAICATLKSLITGFDVYEDLRWPYDTQALASLKNINSLIPAQEGTAAVIKGARLVRDACATALGPHGTNISVSAAFGDSRFDRSGVVIAGATTSYDPLQQKGIEHARRLAQEMKAASGDGSKTAILLFQEMVEAGQKQLDAGIALRDLIHEMDASVELAVRRIESMSRPLTGKDISSVARTAAAGDAQSGQIIAEALQKAGPDGVVFLAESGQAHTLVDVREGIYFDRGFLSTRFITNETRQTAELTNALILMYDAKISSMKSLLPLLEQIAKMGSPLLVIAEDVDGEALETLALNKERGALHCAAVRAPRVQENRQFMLEDIAVATGGTVISHFSVSLESVHVSQLGHAKRVEVTKDSCWITGGAGAPELVESRAAGIRQQIAIERSDYDVDRLQERLAMLVGRVCAIRVGGASSLDRAERMYKMESAMHSARTAMISGVVPGGGLALFRARQDLMRGSEASKAIAHSLEVPMRQQILNARQNEREIFAQIDASSDHIVGFNAEARQVGDLETAGILDATKMCTGALQLAFGHARAILQTGAWDLGERTGGTPGSISRRRLPQE